MRRQGLPAAVRTRHDEHYIETLVTSSGKPIGRLVPIEQVDANPDQPRQVMGDLSELIASIGEKGIIEPLIVRQRGERLQIMAGERRYQAAVQVGLDEVPVVIREADDAEVIEIALIENIQRKDLTPFEEAEALSLLSSKHGHTHQELAKRLGKSRSSITESLSIHAIPGEVKKLCRLADIDSKSLLLEIVRQSTPEEMMALIERIAADGIPTREQLRREKAKIRLVKPGRPKAYVFQFKAPTRDFKLRLSFRKSRVERKEVIAVLEGIIEELRRSKG